MAKQTSKTSQKTPDTTKQEEIKPKKRRGRPPKKKQEIVPPVEEVKEILNINFPENTVIDANLPKELNKSLEEIVADMTHSDIVPDQPLTLLERYVAELRIKGFSIDKIAMELNLANAAVERILNKKNVKSFLKQLSTEIKDTLKDEMVGVLTRIINDKVKEIETKYDGDFSKASRKDIPDLIRILDDILKEEEKAKLGTSQNVFVNILNQVTG